MTSTSALLAFGLVFTGGGVAFADESGADHLDGAGLSSAVELAPSVASEDEDSDQLAEPETTPDAPPSHPLVQSGVLPNGQGLFFVARGDDTEGWGLYITGPRDELLVENYPVQPNARYEFPVSESGWYSLSLRHAEQDSVHAGEFAISVDGGGDWTPASSLTLKPVCGEVQPPTVAINFDFVFAPGEEFAGTYIDGQPTPGDAMVQLLPGTYQYSYVVLNVDTGQTAAVDGGTLTVVSCEDVVDPTPVIPEGPGIDESSFTITVPDDDFDYSVGDDRLAVGENLLGPIGAGVVFATPKDAATVVADGATVEWPFDFTVPSTPVDPDPTEPGTTDPTDPGTTEPGAPDPGTTDPTNPGTTGPGTTDPGVPGEQGTDSSQGAGEPSPSETPASGVTTGHLPTTGLDDGFAWTFGAAGALMAVFGTLLYRRARVA